MISQRVLELVRRMAVDEFGDISGDEENLAHAIARVVEAAEYYAMATCHSCAAEYGAPEEAFELHDFKNEIAIEALKELEIALKGCGV